MIQQVKDLPSWDAVWIRVRQCLADAVTEVAREHPAAWSSTYRARTEAFPFGATVSFGTGDRATADESVVVSVSGFLDGDVLRMSADISRGDGFVLTDGPHAEVSVSDAERNLPELLEPWLNEIEAFLLRDAVSRVVRELSAHPRA